MKKGKGNLEESVKRALEESGVKCVLAGISGGADSVAMLHALKALDIEIHAVHCNFHLRGTESDRDMNFTGALCRRLEIPLEIVDFDVESYKKEHGGSTEMACRNLRYDHFRKLKVLHSCQRIAVAHNSDDNAETLLLNLFRGGGISGLRAMLPDNGEIIRPLLKVSRKEIEDYLAEKGESYVTDSTNLENDYRRNYIRNVILPVIGKEWPGVKESLNRTARIMLEEECFLKSVEKEEVPEYLLEYSRLEQPEKGRWLARRFVLSKGGTHSVADEVVGGLKNIEESKGARWILRDGTLVFGPTGIEWLPNEEAETTEDLSEEFEWIRHENSDELLHEIKNRRDNRSLWTILPPASIRLRKCKEGDRMRPMGMKGSRLVSDMLRDAGLTRRERLNVTVAEERSSREIIWIEGVRRSGKGLVRPESAIVWKLRRGKKEEYKTQ